MEQNDFIKDSLTVLERYYPHGIKIMSFFFAYEAQTGTKFKKPMLRIIQQLRGVETYSQVDKIKKRTKDGKEIKQNVLYLRLTQQGYGELKAIKMKNPIKSIFITQIQNYLSDDFPNHEIFYSNDNDRIETHLQSLISKEESPIIIGFDTEWFPDIDKNMPLTKTALLQLGFKNHVVLIHLIYLSKIPPTLVEILKNPKYIKVCQSPGQDMDRLLKGYGLVVEGMIDLQYVSTVYGLKGSLKSIYNQVCGKDMVRPSCACSNWEIIPLIDSQISYAALDAIQTRESFFLIHKMNAKQEEDMIKWIENNKFWFSKPVPEKLKDNQSILL